MSGRGPDAALQSGAAGGTHNTRECKRGEASVTIRGGGDREGRIAEITSDRICLSPFTKDNRGCGFMNATLTQISVRREAVK